MPVPFDPHAITKDLQSTLLAYASNPPRDRNGYTKFLALLGYRQGGKSTTAENAFYPLAAYTPGWDHQCYADTRWRADYLHKRVQYMHHRWPEDLRTPTVNSRETRQLTFDPRIGGTMVTRSLETNASGIGQSPNSLHISEVPFATYAAEQWTMVQPSVINKREVRVILEATPAPADQPSVEFWKETCDAAKEGMGRWVYAFFPFWDGKLNQRPWPSDWHMTNEEVRLLEEYGPKGMTKENLAFRREMMDTDKDLRRNPDLFGVWYPMDDVKCWAGSSRSVIPQHALERHIKGILLPKPRDYVEFKGPRPGALYAIGVDPAGFAARDHASFQVLEIWEDKWEQVAHFSAHEGDPDRVADLLERTGKRYNNAYICVETNGVGVATFAALKRKGYRNLFYEGPKKPGWTSTTQSVEESLGWLVDALLDKLVIRCEKTMSQLLSYKADKAIQQTAKQEQIRNGRPLKGRRARHHWDSVSALIFAVVAARRLPQNRRPELPPEGVDTEKVALFRDMSWNDVNAHLDKVAEDKAAKRNNRRTYTRLSRRRR